VLREAPVKLDLRPWVVAAVGLLVLYLARHAVSPFIVAAVLAYIFTPTVDTLARRTRLPRALVVAFLYSVGIVLAVGLVLVLERPLVRETHALIGEGPRILDRLLTQALGGDYVVIFGQVVTAGDLANSITAATHNSLGQPDRALRLAEGLVGFLVSTILCLIATFYLLLDGRRVGSYLIRFVPADRREEVVVVARRIHAVLGRYLRGQLFLIGLMATVTYVCLTAIFGLHYSLPIAIASGFLEIIPFVGPAIAAALAASVGFAQGGLEMALGIVVLYFVLRQIEDQAVMPLVVGRAVHLHPLATIFAVVVGEAVAGVLGMLLAVPIIAAAKVVLDHLYPAPAEPELEEPKVEPGSGHVREATP